MSEPTQACPSGTTDADGNYPDEIEFDPATAVIPDAVPGEVLKYWILKCHRKNAQIAELQRSQSVFMPLLQALADAPMSYSDGIDVWQCPFCLATLADGNLNILGKKIALITLTRWAAAKQQIAHAPDCSVLAARALLAGGQE